MGAGYISALTKCKKNMNKEIEILWDFLVDNQIATEKELELITYINGYNLKSLNDVLEVRTGYKDLEQYIEMEVVEL